MPKEMFTSLG